MEPSQPAFTILSQLSKWVDKFLYNRSPGWGHQTRQNVALGLHIFRNLVEENKHGRSKHVKT